MLTSTAALVLAKVTLILGLALLAALALGRAPANVRHRLWLVTIVAVLVAPALAMWAPLRVALLPPSPAHALRSPAVTIPVGSVPTPMTAAASTSDRSTPATAALSAIDHPSAAVTPPDSPLPDAGRLTTDSPSPLTLAILVWAVVALAILAVLVRAELAVRAIVRRATPLDAPEWRATLYEISDRLSLGEPPRLAYTGEVGMPFAWGLLHPVVVLPEDCEHWSDDRRRAVLLHELAHVRRRDLLGHALSRVVAALWWFHPLVWTAGKRLRVESERACDDLALLHGAVASDYAEHLLDIVTSVRRTRMPVAALAMARPSEFEGRMLAILDPECPRLERHRLRTVTTTATMALLALSIGAAAPARRATPASAPTTNPMRRLTSGTDARGGAPAGDTAIARESAKARPTLEPRVSPAPSPAPSLASPAAPLAVPSPLSTPVADTNPPATRAALLANVLRTDTSANLRRVAAWGLSEFAEQPVAVQALVAALRGDRSADVREMAAWALSDARSGGDQEAALVAALGHDADAKVRTTAAWALGSIGDRDAVPALTTALSDTSARVKERAAWALGNAGVDQAPKQLVALLGDREPRVRELAAWALYEIGDASAVPALERALHDEQDPKLQVAYIRALVAVGDNDKSVSALSELLQSKDARVRDMAVRALAGGGARGPWPWPWPEPRPYP